MRITVGIDAAKKVHWATAMSQDGRVLLDRKVVNAAEDIDRLADELAFENNLGAWPGGP